MSTRPLNVSRNATADANGRAVARLGPQVFGETWHVTRMVVFTVTSNNSEARVYLNAEQPSSLIGGTYAGEQDFNETVVDLATLDTLICVWNAVPVGDIAVFSLQGTTSSGR